MSSIFGIFIIVLITSSFACSNSKNMGKEVNEKLSGDIVSSEKVQYRFIASFYSPGDGVDHKIKKMYLEFLNKSYPKIVFITKSWGREGEVDLYFTLKTLDSSSQEKFVKESKEILGKSAKVNIYENSSAKH